MFKSVGANIEIFVLVLAASSILSAPAFAQRVSRGSSVPPDVALTEQQEIDFSSLLNMQDVDKKIKLAGQFLKNYPTSQHKAVVYDQLVKAYYNKRDWEDFYPTADMALAAYPDDVDVLALVGWVIPHFYNPGEAEAGRMLIKAETYEKHAMELIPAMHKPPSLSDDQFAAAKSENLFQVHSGLGLVYYRAHNWEASVKELQEATQTNPFPDPTDLYALAFSLEQLNRYAEAADTYQKCSESFSSLQARCKISADEARSEALQAK
jgi:tetratricopeptide (TPR) repeat protein